MKIVTSCIVVLTLCFAFFGTSLTTLGGKRAAVDETWRDIAGIYQERAAVAVRYVQRVSPGLAAADQPPLREVSGVLQVLGQLPPDPRQSVSAWQKYQAAQETLTGALAQLMAAQQRSHRLASDDRANDLVRQLEGLEGKITVAQKRFNVAAHDFNMHKRGLAAAVVNALVLHLPDCHLLGTGEGVMVVAAADR